MTVEHKTYGSSFHCRRGDDGDLILIRGGVRIEPEELLTSEVYLVKDFLRIEAEKKKK
jgi:hypothetical protein